MYWEDLTDEQKEQERSEWDNSLAEFFDRAFDMAKRGDITYNDVRDFFPAGEVERLEKEGKTCEQSR